MDLIQIFQTAIFYVLIIIFYTYGKGKWRFKEKDKMSSYLNWVEKYGARVSKAFLHICVIYTLILIYNILF
jgi:hypothetical protein